MFKNLEFFLFRRPLRSTDVLYEFHKRLSFSSFESELRAFYKKDVKARQAIYIASPDLYERFTLWLNNMPVTEVEQLQVSLYKYLVRMCTRSTPFGLFAGCAVGNFEDITILKDADDTNIRTNIRLRMEVLGQLRDYVLRNREVRSQLNLIQNPSLYRLGEYFRYIEEVKSGGRKQFFMSSFQDNPYIGMILDTIRDGKITLFELLDKMTRIGVKYSDATCLIDELIKSKILLFEIEPTITGEDYLDKLIKRLSHIQGANAIVRKLKGYRNLLFSCENDIQNAAVIYELLNQDGLRPNRKDIIKVDTFFSNLNVCIERDIVLKIQTQLSKLFVFSVSNNNVDLHEFKRQFTERYGDQEVALNLALDTESGLGYGKHGNGSGYSPFIDEILVPSNNQKQAVSSETWLDDFLAEKLCSHLANYEGELVIAEKDLVYLSELRRKQEQSRKKTTSNLSGYILGSLVNVTQGKTANSNFLFSLSSASDNSALPLLGRFSEGDLSLKNHLKRLAIEEEEFSPNVVFAEIVYSPESKGVDVLSRNSLYTYEIPCLGISSVDYNYQITLNDLYVSIQNDEVILRSKRINKRIIPKSSNAHNYSTGLPVYKFLCDVGRQNSNHFKWRWGAHEKNKYLPRVRFQNIIISRARWIIEMNDLKGTNFISLASELEILGLPKCFVFANGDNEMFIDCQIEMSLMILWKELKKGKTVILYESLFFDENGIPRRTGVGANEVIIPFINQQALPWHKLTDFSEKGQTRNFLLGSEWLYMKIYLGEKLSDVVLSKVIYHIVNEQFRAKLIDKFFFVRYKDADSHLRLRFHGGSDDNFYVSVINSVQQSLSQYLSDGLISKIQIDTYKRELNRYGSKTIEICESIFSLDSLAVLVFLNSAQGVFNEKERLSFAIKRIEYIFDCCRFSVIERNTLINEMKEKFFEEFDGDLLLRRRLGQKYRILKDDFSNSLPAFDMEVLYPLNNLFEEIILVTRERKQIYSIVTSIIHMTLNRVFPSKQRAYELLIYHCLAKDSKRSAALVTFNSCI